MPRTVAGRTHLHEWHLIEGHAGTSREWTGDIDDGSSIRERIRGTRGAEIVPCRREHHACARDHKRDAENPEGKAKRMGTLACCRICAIDPKQREAEKERAEQKAERGL